MLRWLRTALLLVVGAAALAGKDRTALRTVPVSSMPGLQNLLQSPGFEAGAGGWAPYDQGFAIDQTEARSGARSLRAISGAVQELVLAQDRPRPIAFAAASKAAAVTGQPDSDYSLWLDVQYTGGSWTFGLSRPFAVGAHDWQTVEGIFAPEKPIQRVMVYLLFRGDHTGQVWFDDVLLSELPDDAVLFDGVPVRQPRAGCTGVSALEVATADGLRLALSQPDGTIVGLRVGEPPVGGQDDLAYCPARAASGFFVRDVAVGSDFVRLEPAASASGSGLALRQSDGPLGLSFQATITPRTDHMEIEAHIQNQKPDTDRAITLYFALPLDAQRWTWWDDLRGGHPVDGPNEFRNTIPVEWGATAAYSPHLLASLTGASGLALAYPMDSPAALRFAYNNSLKLFYVAFDLALTKDTAKFPNQATVRFTLYQHAAEWGLRAALDKYQKIYPEFFEKRVQQEGIWVAFDSLESIPHPEDFGFQFHEVAGFDQLAFDQQAGVSAFRYLSEPWSYWMSMPPGSDSSNYQAVTGFLAQQARGNGTPDARRAEAAVLSGVFYRGDRLLFWPQSRPWMPYGAVVVNNPNPDIGDAGSPIAPSLNPPKGLSRNNSANRSLTVAARKGCLSRAREQADSACWHGNSMTGANPPVGPLVNKACLDWNDDVQQIYQSPAPGRTLAGEYIDSFEATGTLLDYRRSHFAASSFPLTFSKDQPRIAGVPQVFSTYEFARSVGADLRSRYGKLLMANGALNQMAFYAHLFDVLGSEINWATDGRWTPESDRAMLFRRMYAGSKPYLLLMDTDFSRFAPAMVDQYFQTALFYAMYPSMFSADASTHTYWTNPALYERDRPLFRRYIPWIRALSQAGWQPVTGARTSQAGIPTERYGQGDGAIFTVRNEGEQAVAVRLEIDPVTVGLSAEAQFQAIEWIGGLSKNLESDGRKLFLTTILAPGQTQCWQLRRQ